MMRQARSKPRKSWRQRLVFGLLDLTAVGLLALVASLAVMARSPAARAVEKLRCPLAPDDMVFIAGGTATFGNAHAYANEGPEKTITVKSFWIDRHEVTNRQFAAFVASTGYVTEAEKAGESVVFVAPKQAVPLTDPNAWWQVIKGADWKHPQGPGSDIRGLENLPVVQVTYADAKTYAKWAGRDLPSEEQFEYAARAGAANSDAQPAPDEANTFQGHFPDHDLQTDGYRGLAPAGCYKANAYGLNDMIGNAWEWTKSWYLPGHGAYVVGEGAPQTPGNPSYDPNQPGVRVRVIKGGSFLCAPTYCARYRPSARHAQDETGATSHIGFRTVRNQT